MTAHVHRFGNYRIDPSARELQHAGELVVLSPKVFDCLAYLIAHRDRAVGRDELIAAVWGKVDVSDTLLGQTVLKARRAIGDTGNEQNAIRTIPRFGYRWVADLTIDDEAERRGAEGQKAAAPESEGEKHSNATSAAIDAAVAEQQPQVPTGAFSARRRTLVGVAVFMVCALLAAFFWLRRPPTEPDAAVGVPTAATMVDTIAVLPVVVDGSEEWAWLRLGLMDLIGMQLRRGGQAVVPSDNVVALTRAEASTPGSDPSTAIRERTGARYTLLPRVSRLGEQWQVHLDLLGADGRRNEVQTQGRDPIEAARSASDRLLTLLGMPPAAEDVGGELPLTQLLQRTEAALLGDDFASARRLIESAPQEQRDTPTVRLRLAQIDFRTGNLEAARASLETLRAQVSAETDPVLRARVLQTLGAIAIRDARNADAVVAFEEAIALTETRREPGVLGKSYTGLAIAMLDLQRFDEAANALARARVALSLAGDALALAGVDDNEGLLANARGRPAEALPALQRAADTVRRFGIVNDLALVVAAQIDTHLALLDANGALAVSEAFLAQRSQLTNPRGRNSFDLRRARALAATGRLASARALLYELQHASASEGQAGLLGAVATELAALDLESGNADAAAASARTALAGLTQAEQAGERAEAWLTLSRALRADGLEAEAREQVAQFAQWVRAYPAMPKVGLLAALAEAEQTWTEHHTDEAWHAYAAALAEAERRGVPEDIVTVIASYGNALITDKELDRASAVIGRVARWSEQNFDCALLQARLYRALGESGPWQSALTRVRALAMERSIPTTVAAAMEGTLRGAR
ncbi:MAG: winged helix-turn-helix domain-containing protein [Dokdonella sp.]